MALNTTLYQSDFIDICRAFHPQTADCTFFSGAHGTFSRIDHILRYSTSYHGRVSTFRFAFQIEPTHLAPAGEGPLHTELLVTSLGVHWSFGELCAHVIGHRCGDPRGFQLLAGHPAGLDASPAGPGTGRPGGHHPPEERKRSQSSGQESGVRERGNAGCPQKKFPMFSPPSC